MDENTGNAPSGTPDGSQSNDLDISKTTITVLVLLTLIISVIGTWTVLHEVSTMQPAQQQKTSTSTGVTRLNVLTGNEPPAQPQLSATTGRVVLKINPSK